MRQDIGWKMPRSGVIPEVSKNNINVLTGSNVGVRVKPLTAWNRIYDSENVTPTCSSVIEVGTLAALYGDLITRRDANVLVPLLARRVESVSI
jgi:hypothetical protein